MESDDPKHYKDKDIETWDAIHSQVSDEEFIGYLKGIFLLINTFIITPTTNLCTKLKSNLMLTHIKNISKQQKNLCLCHDDKNTCLSNA